ncbi:hypothetical protein SAMN05192578_10970 [Sphingobacterium mizutaii]|nr:hypothetical protein SAMN05192578_10970 [Sphingobacterium mizutaii]
MASGSALLDYHYAHHITEQQNQGPDLITPGSVFIVFLANHVYSYVAFSVGFSWPYGFGSLPSLQVLRDIQLFHSI